jgi:hypothetical protein
MTYTELQVLWDERDRRYVYLHYPLTLEQIHAVRRWRYTEASELPLGSVPAQGQATTWTPPERKDPSRIW